MRILLIVDVRFNSMGGHKFSSLALAKALVDRGHEVGLLIERSNYETPGLNDAPFRLHYTTSPVEKNSRATLLRDIPNYTNQHAYECLIAMDWWAGILAVPFALRRALPLIQIEAGGPLKPFPFLYLPGTVVFSDELFKGIPVRYKIPSEHLILSSGRVDFEYLQYQSREEPQNELFDTSQPTLKLLLVSSFSYTKVAAIKNTLDQVHNVAQRISLQFTLIGDGAARSAIQDYAAVLFKDCLDNVAVKFMGAIRVRPSDLVQADLVIGQGRTVIEAVATGVPAAVCGSEGYKGLLTSSRLSLLASSNLTGRGIIIEASLLDDLGQLEWYRTNEFASVWQMAHKLYDASYGAEAIEQAIALSIMAYPNPLARRWAYLKAFVRTMGKTALFYVKHRLKISASSPNW